MPQGAGRALDEVEQLLAGDSSKGAPEGQGTDWVHHTTPSINPRPAWRVRAAANPLTLRQSTRPLALEPEETWRGLGESRGLCVFVRLRMRNTRKRPAPPSPILMNGAPTVKRLSARVFYNVILPGEGR
jgi:hypothetical protein